MWYFIVKVPLNVEFEMNLKADAAVWHSDIHLVDA
jgi:hypothetical protein